MQRIAIIGGGAAGAAVVAQFLRNAADDDDRRGDCALTWIVGDRAPGRGVAYATADEQHLLNVRAANMGLFADRPGDFLDYAAARGIAAAGGQFLPRAIYGDYVEATLARLLATARRRVTLAARSTEAVAIRPLADGFGIRTRDGEEIRADGVVLALGALPPASLPGVGAAALASGAYAADAWRWPELARPPAHVLVIGSGLTGVDALLSATARWPLARLTAVSRRGRWPALHSGQPLAPYAEAAALLARLREKSDLRHWLRAIRAAAGARDADWRAVLDAVRAETPRLWQALDTRQRVRFLRHLRPSWETVRHRMPPQTAAKLRTLQDEGRLRLLAARVRGIEVDATTTGDEAGAARLLARLQPRGDAHERVLTADFVIQATGLESAAASTPHALVRQLVDDGVVGADALGLGLTARADGRLLRPDGSAWTGLYALGTLLRGAAWECTGMPEIRAAARDIARELPAGLADAGVPRPPERRAAVA